MPQRPRAPHLNVVIFCSLLRVHKHLEASLTNIEMGVPGALMETVGSKIRRLSQYTPKSTVATAVQAISFLRTFVECLVLAEDLSPIFGHGG